MVEINDVSQKTFRLSDWESKDSFETIFYNDTIARINGGQIWYKVDEKGPAPLFVYDGKVFNIKSNINMEIVLYYSQSYKRFVPRYQDSLTFSYEKIITFTKTIE